MMEWDKSRVYTALNADELKEGDKVYVGNSIAELQNNIANKKLKPGAIKEILPDDVDARFVTRDGVDYYLAYLVDKVRYRPFRNTEELIDVWCEKLFMSPLECQNLSDSIVMPSIWVQDKKRPKVRYLINGFMENEIHWGGYIFNMQELFDNFEFLDGTPCGVEE